MSVLGRSLPLGGSAGVHLRSLAPVFSTVFVAMLWWVGFRPFVSQIAGDIDASVPLVGQIATLAGLTTALTGLFAGPLADHYGLRRSITVGLSSLSASAALFALAPNIVVMAIGGLLGGLGIAMTYGVAFAVVSSRFLGDARREALGKTQAAGSLATMAGPPALVALATVFLWRGSFLLMATLLLGAVFVAARGLPSDAPPAGRCVSPRSILAAYCPVLAAPAVRVLYVVSVLRSITVVGLAVYLGAFYFDVLEFSSREVGIAFMLDGTGQVLGSLAAGGRLGRFHPRAVFALGTLLTGAAAVTVYSVQPGPVATIALAMSMAFIAGITFTNLTTMMAQETSAGAATTMVLNISMVALGVALGSAIGGVLIGLAGYRAIGVAALLVALACTALVYLPQGSRAA